MAESSLAPQMPKQVFASEAGSLELWSRDSGMLKAARVCAARFFLNPRAFSLPKYSDAHQIFYVFQGEGRVGVVFPGSSQEYVKKIKKGDALCIPQGSVNWWFNNGSDQLSVLILGDTSKSIRDGESTEFHLFGGKSVMQGFSTDFLAQAWDLEEEKVKQILGSQKGALFVKVDEDIKFPDDADLNYDCKTAPFGEFAFNCEDESPDVDVKNGGRVVNLPSDLVILEHLQLGADLVKLDAGAMCSPGFSADGAYQVTYITRGSGRVQVVNNEGHRVIDAQLEAGNLFIVPRFHIVSKRACDKGLEWFSIITAHNPIFSQLGGKTSIWKSLSSWTIKAAFKVDEETEQELRQQRFQDAIFFPPRS